jgi:hypothetical protein
MIRKSRLISSARFSLAAIPGYEGYAATSEGQIVKLFENGTKLAVLSEHFRYGLRVAIVRPDGSETTAPVAKLVALAYHPGGPGDVLFRDGNQRNCHPSNVYWDPDTPPVDPASIEDLREAPGVPGIYVSADGGVYSTRSPHGDGLLRKVKCAKVTGGYLIVKVLQDGIRVNQYVHRLICEAFHGPSRDPLKQNACHRNDIKDDNRAENLYWGSDLDNKQDAIRNGRTIPMEQVRHKRATQVGENAVCVKLTEEIVRQIRQRNSNGEKYAALAREFGTHPNTIRLICLRQTWTHVE